MTFQFTVTFLRNYLSKEKRRVNRKRNGD